MRGTLTCRYPNRPEIPQKPKVVSRDYDDEAKQDIVKIQFKVTDNLSALERAVIQVCASVRAGAQNDGIFESMEKTIGYFPAELPMAVAFTASLPKGRRSALFVVGANLEDATIDLQHDGGPAIQSTHQHSESRMIGALVNVDQDVLANKAILTVTKGSISVGTFEVDLKSVPQPRGIVGADPPSDSVSDFR